MDINFEYAAHQSALMRAAGTLSASHRRDQFAKAAHIAGRIRAFQLGLGAAAACAWSAAQLSAAEQS